MILGESGMGVRRRFPEMPKHRSRPAAMAMFSPRRRPSPGSPVRGLDASRPHRSEAVDVDHGLLVGRHLHRCAVVISLDKLAPVGWRAAGR